MVLKVKIILTVLLIMIIFTSCGPKLTIEEWNSKAMGLLLENKLEEALECYNKALEIDPNDLFTLVGKGRVLNELKKYEEAIKCYDKLIELQPEKASPWVFKGDTLLESGMTEEALECFDRALEIDPENEDAKKGKDKALKAS